MFITQKETDSCYCYFVSQKLKRFGTIVLNFKFHTKFGLIFSVH